MWIIVIDAHAVVSSAVIYFDRHSGWFDQQVYAPYANAAQLDAYQPKSGAAALLAGKKKLRVHCGTCHGTDGMGKPGQSPPLAGSEWVTAKGFNGWRKSRWKDSAAGHVKGQEWNA